MVKRWRETWWAGAEAASSARASRELDTARGAVRAPSAAGCLCSCFFFKQKTAYEISRDWSSDVCSSDLSPRGPQSDPNQLINQKVKLVAVDLQGLHGGGVIDRQQPQKDQENHPAKEIPIEAVLGRVFDFFQHLLKRSEEETKESEENSDQPKPHGHLSLGPTLYLKVVMDRRHQERLPSSQFDGPHLQNHGKAFRNKHSSNHQNQKRALQQHRQRHKRGRPPQRSHITGKKPRRKNIEIEKRQESTQEDAGRNRQVVLAEHQSQRENRRKRDHEKPSRQPVQSIRDADAVHQEEENYDYHREISQAKLDGANNWQPHLRSADG